MLKFWVWPVLGLDAENAATDIAIAITKIIERRRTVRRKVERLAEALRKPEERDEAADAIDECRPNLEFEHAIRPAPAFLLSA